MSSSTLAAGISRTPALDVELIANGKVLNVLERQLTEVAEDVESSVTGICQGFRGMANKAKEAVETAGSSMGVSETGEDSTLIAEMHSVLEQIVQSNSESCEYSKAVSDRLNNLEERLGGIERTLKDIEDLASRAKLVALNGQVEAARWGESGAAFRVVAQETKELSLRAADASGSIRELVGKLSNEIKETSSELNERSKHVTERFSSTKSQALELLQGIARKHQQMTESLSNAAEIGRELRNEIAQAVMSLQFQDRVSQRIAHVIETLQILVARADEEADGAYEPAAQELSSELLMSIAGRYTMDSERMALGLAGPHCEQAGATSSECELELF